MSVSSRNVNFMFAVLDTETTGLSPKSNRVIEVGVVALDSDGTVEWEWSTLLNPEQDVGATHVHGISQQDVESAPTFSHIGGTLTQLLTGRVLVAHNISFDAGMLRAEFARNSLPQLAQPWLCTALQAKKQGFRPYRLDACCQTLGISLVNAHTALGDARATAELFPRVFDLAGVQVQTAVAAARTSRSDFGIVSSSSNVAEVLTRDSWIRKPDI